MERFNKNTGSMISNSNQIIYIHITNVKAHHKSHPAFLPLNTIGLEARFGD
jgi:hypothetical protein